MKKLILISAMALFAMNGQAQGFFGIKGGGNLATISNNKEGGIDKNNILTSFHVGFISDIPLGVQVLSFQPALTLSGKGAQYDLIKLNDHNYGTVKINPFYVNLQTNIVFNIPFSDEFKLFAGAGPYFAVGVFGKAKFNGKVLGLEINKETNLIFDNENSNDNNLGELDGYNHLKRFDFGLNLVAGARISKIMVSANYEWGMAKLHPGTANSKDDFGKNRLFSLSLGFLF